jgi:hypothetical protein
MRKDSVVAIVEALNRAGIRYVIVGGLAVVAHGFVRFTADVDLLLSMEEENLEKTVTALETLGYRPRAPVSFDEFCNADKRREWAQQKNMVVFSLFSDIHLETEIDLFLEPPIDFETAYGRAMRQEILPGAIAVFCSLDDLIQLKKLAGRAEDQIDIAQLEQLRQDGNE